MRALAFVFCVTLSVNSAFAQYDGANTAAKIEFSILPGVKMPQGTENYSLDTANIRPANFSFRISEKKDLTDRLETGVYLPDVSCKPSWGLFMFRVNSRGLVDTTSYRGNLAPSITNKILSNICATEGHWIVKKGTAISHVAWFVYPFFDIRGRIPRKKECSESDMNILDAVASLSNLVAIIYYQVGREYHNATIIRPTQIDGTPKL